MSTSKNFILAILILLTTTLTFAQPKRTTSKLNLDFEAVEKGIPSGWNTF
jgi:hypothetical protein